MNVSKKSIATFVLAATVSLWRNGSAVDASCGNQAAVAPTNHSESSGISAGANCTNCFTFVDSYTSSDSCEESEGNNCVWVANSVVVTRQDYECANVGGTWTCQANGAPYELPTRRGQYVTHACPGFPGF
ncbi:MAG: hypothetical protein HYR85_12965 [Planctomycetes bacterium]|nr:hypothetical protein [Planctomycetota bacterium]MBI3847887.1 hypothetical protein [Planctomycetota bacterium]